MERVLPEGSLGITKSVVLAEFSGVLGLGWLGSKPREAKSSSKEASELSEAAGFVSLASLWRSKNLSVSKGLALSCFLAVGSSFSWLKKPDF